MWPSVIVTHCYIRGRKTYEHKRTRKILCIFPAYIRSFGTLQHTYRLFAAVNAFYAAPPIRAGAYLLEEWKARENLARASATDSQVY